MKFKSSIIILLLICFGIGMSFGDTVKSISTNPHYYFNGNEFETIRVYEVEDSEGDIKELILLRDLTKFGYSLNWNGITRTIEIVHGTSATNLKTPVVNIGTKIVSSDIKTKFYKHELIETYVSNGLSFIDLERLPYAYYDYLPDGWAKPYFYSLNATGNFYNNHSSFRNNLTVDQLSGTIANILSDKLQSFNRSEYLSRGKSDYEGLLEKGIFNGVSVNATSFLSREEIARIGNNILDYLHIDYKTIDVATVSYADRASVGTKALNSVDLFFNADILTVNAKNEIMPKTVVSIQESIVILCKMLEKFNIIEQFTPYTKERLNLSDLKFESGFYEINALSKPLTLSIEEPKLTLYNAFIKTNNGTITLEIDQDYASMGSIYTNNALSPQITQVDVVLKNGEKIQKNMGRMPNYNYIGSGIYRTYIQLNPPVQGMNESTKVIKLIEIESIIIHAPKDVLVKLIL